MNKHFLEEDIAAIANQLGAVAHDFSGKTLLLSGGRGFLGRYFTQVFLYLNQRVLASPCQNYRVVRLSHRQFGRWQNWYVHSRSKQTLFQWTIINNKLNLVGT